MSTVTEKPKADSAKIPLAKLLTKLRACEDAREWADDQDAEKAWNECERGEWLIWIAARLEVDRKLIVAAACECARLALPYVRKGEDRPLKAIETAERWIKGEATIDEVRAAANAANAAANAAYSAYAANAANAAANAAYSAYSAYSAYAAANAANAAYSAYSAYAAANAAYAAARNKARTETRKKWADIARKVIPYRVVAAKAKEALK